MIIYAGAHQAMIELNGIPPIIQKCTRILNL